MSTTTVSAGALHAVPDDLRGTLVGDAAAHATWEDITPLARNEWICWITSARQAATREKRIERARENLAEGKRRPCCWPGCDHRERTGR